MAFGSFQQGDGPAPMAEINTTPLVDVMLVLLVIFIITAPLFQQAVPIDLPRVESQKLEDKPEVLALALDGDGRLFLDGAEIDRGAFSERARAAVERASAARATPPELQLRADRDTRYERVAEVMAAASKVGLTRIAFVTDPGAGNPK